MWRPHKDSPSYFIIVKNIYFLVLRNRRANSKADVVYVCVCICVCVPACVCLCVGGWGDEAVLLNITLLHMHRIK